MFVHHAFMLIYTYSMHFLYKIKKCWKALSVVMLADELSNATLLNINMLKFFTAIKKSLILSPTSVLEGRCPAEFSSNLPQHISLEVSNKPSKTLISCFRCVWLGLELNSAGHRPYRTVWWPLPKKTFSQWFFKEHLFLSFL